MCLDPAFDLAEALEARGDVVATPAWEPARAVGQGLAEGLTGGVPKVDPEADSPLVRIEFETPTAHAAHDARGDGSDPQVGAVGPERSEATHRRVLPTDVHDGVRLRPVEVRIEAPADGDEHLSGRIVAHHPVPLVGARIPRPHHPDGVGGLVDEVIVQW